MDKFADEFDFDFDFSEIHLLVERSFDFLEIEGVKFDFNDPVILRIVKMDVELCIRHLNEGRSLDLMNFVFLNDFDDGKEIINDLEAFKQMFDSEIYRKTLEKMYNDSGEGRPPFDVVLMFEILVLQVLFDYSDNGIIKWVKTSPFKWFLDYPEDFPAESTYWNFKEKLIDFDLLFPIWEVHQQQLDSYGFGFTSDVLEIGQDSKIIETNQGNYSAPRGNKAKTRRSKDGTRVKKGNKWFFGYKLHQIMDLTYQMIRIFDVTTASVHDASVKFSMINKILYGDKGYVGIITDSYPGYMLRKSNDPLINEYRKQRNKRISSKRAPIERPFSTIEHLNVDKVKTTTIPRTTVIMLIACMIFNIKQSITLQKQEKQEKKEEKEDSFDYNLSIDMSLINGKAQKRLKFIQKLKKRSEKSRKNRKINQYMYKKPVRYKKTKKDEKSNLTQTKVKKLDHTFHKMQ